MKKIFVLILFLSIFMSGCTFKNLDQKEEVNNEILFEVIGIKYDEGLLNVTILNEGEIIKNKTVSLSVFSSSKKSVIDVSYFVLDYLAQGDTYTLSFKLSVNLEGNKSYIGNISFGNEKKQIMFRVPEIQDNTNLNEENFKLEVQNDITPKNEETSNFEEEVKIEKINATTWKYGNITFFHYFVVDYNMDSRGVLHSIVRIRNDNDKDIDFSIGSCVPKDGPQKNLGHGANIHQLNDVPPLLWTYIPAHDEIYGAVGWGIPSWFNFTACSVDFYVDNQRFVFNWTDNN